MIKLMMKVVLQRASLREDEEDSEEEAEVRILTQGSYLFRFHVSYQRYFSPIQILDVLYLLEVFLNQITGVHFTIGAACSGGCSPLCCVSQIWKYNTHCLFSSRYQFISICKYVISKSINAGSLCC